MALRSSMDMISTPKNAKDTKGNFQSMVNFGRRRCFALLFPVSNFQFLINSHGLTWYSPPVQSTTKIESNYLVLKDFHIKTPSERIKSSAQDYHYQKNRMVYRTLRTAKYSS